MNTGKICIAICATSVGELLTQIHRAEPLADVIEIRFDCLTPARVADALVGIRKERFTKPLIATYRSPGQGGSRDLTREERLQFWHELGEGFAYSDLESDIIGEIETSAEAIVSYHDLAGVPADLDALYQRLASTNASVIKIAITSDDVCDALPVWKLHERAKSDDRHIIPIAMGEAGKWTRILGLAHGSLLTYASLGASKETADGQLTVDDLVSVYRVKELDRETRVYGVIGNPVSSSLSPYMHNAAFAKAGLDAVFLPLSVNDLEAFMRRMVLPRTREINLNFAGFAVTMPHKQAIQSYLTEIDPCAQRIGAVNTVKIEGLRLTGHNTDADGFIAPLKQRIPDLKGIRAAVLGAGGGARAVIYALQREGADVTVFARHPQKETGLADEFDVRIAPLATDQVQLTDYELLINATPLGMIGLEQDKTLFMFDRLSGIRCVYDLVTRADDTPLIREAKATGVDTISGVEMLISQGIKQFEIWTGREAPVDTMRRAVLDRLK